MSHSISRNPAVKLHAPVAHSDNFNLHHPPLYYCINIQYYGRPNFATKFQNILRPPRVRRRGHQAHAIKRTIGALTGDGNRIVANTSDIVFYSCQQRACLINNGGRTLALKQSSDTRWVYLKSQSGFENVVPTTTSARKN
jgi:hypothetical protein